VQALTIRFQSQTIRVPLPKTEVNVGASASNEISIPFPGVSRVHARLTPTRGGAVLTDLGSKNQIVVNGKRTNRAELAPGVVIHLGHAMLTIEDASTGDLIAAYPIESETKRNTSGAQTESQTQSPSAAALALIRDIERMPDRAIRQRAQSILFSARDLVAAELLFLFDQALDGEIALLATTGAVEHDLLDAVSTAARTRREGMRILAPSSGSIVLATHRIGRKIIGIAALFSSGASEWEKDFVEYLALKLSNGDRKSSSPPTEIKSQLFIPEEMIVGTSTAMTSLLTEIAATVHSRLDVLLLGETGTGKELIARMIHASGPTATGPFVAINCAAIPSELLEAELFGVQGRVATGVDPRPGLFAQANGGSIFLDEIGELADGLQAKLLRVLQEREILPLGASSPKKIDVRVIAASNRDLLAGEFRSDLYYRLNGLQFHLPPLRERTEDIVPLAIAFASRTADEYGKRIRGMSRKAMDLLMSHAWPGNIRELQAEVARAVLRCADGAVLQREHFTTVPLHIETPARIAPTPTTSTEDLQTRVESVEREAIADALRASAGNKSLAARILGITRNGLALKMRRLKMR